MQKSAVTKHELLEGIQNIQTLHPMNKHLTTSAEFHSLLPE